MHRRGCMRWRYVLLFDSSCLVKTWARWESNPHGLFTQGILSPSCLPFHHSPPVKMEAAPGFEPGNCGFADRCLTTWLSRRFKITRGIICARLKMSSVCVNSHNGNCCKVQYVLFFKAICGLCVVFLGFCGILFLDNLYRLH